MSKIKGIYWQWLIMGHAIIIVLAAGCTKEDSNEVTLPVVTTLNVSGITSTTAVCRGNITSDGGADITARGICWSITPDPTIADYKSNDGSVGTGGYWCNIFGLTGNTTYYVRAYATNSAGTGYGDGKSFSTSALSEYATTQAATDVTSSAAILNAMVNANYLTTDVYFEYGTSTSYGNLIMASPGSVTGDINTNVTTQLTGLTALTTYHFRVKIVNSSGIGFGNDMTFTTYYVIGDIVYGGIIFYSDDSGGHGLVCATADQGTGIQWYNGNNVVTGATGTAIGTGLVNTTAIVAAQGSGNYAAKICDDLVLSGYDDWFLPSKDELNLMYVNLKMQGLGGFPDYYPYAWYWSSSEINDSQAWGQWFGGGSTAGMQDQEPKAASYSVRAVRAY
jgi:hypothetical protein